MPKQALSRTGFDYMLDQADLLSIFKQSGSPTFVTGRFAAGKAASLGGHPFWIVNTTGINLISNGPGTSHYLDTGLYGASYTTGAACFALSSSAALAGVFVYRVSASATAAQLTLELNYGLQTWKIYRGTLAGTLLASGTDAAILNIGSTYLPVQFGWTISDTVGRIYLRVNGTTLIDGTANFDTNNAGGGIWDRNSMGCTTETSMYIDDIVVFNMDTDAFTTLPRDARFYLGVPTGNNTVAWTPNSGTNFAAAATNDTDTLYNSSSTAGQQDLFDISATWIPAGATIYGTPQLVRRSRIDDATPRDVKSAIRSVATTVFGATTAEVSTYKLWVDEIALDPNGNIAWTLASLQVVDIGYNLVA